MVSENINRLLIAFGNACLEMGKAYKPNNADELNAATQATMDTAGALRNAISTLESANARLTAELSALRAEKAELDSGMHEMRAYRDGYDPKTKPPTETGEYLCLLRIGDPEIGDRFAVIDWDGTRFRCLDCTVLRYWPLPAGKGGE